MVPSRRLILFCQHNGENPFGDSGIGRIWGVKVQVLIVIVNFKHDGYAFELERAKVMFAVRIIGGAKIIESRNGLYQPLNCFCA